MSVRSIYDCQYTPFGDSSLSRTPLLAALGILKYMALRIRHKVVVTVNTHTLSQGVCIYDLGRVVELHDG